MKGKLLYEETHGFTGTWMWYLALFISIGIVSQFLIGIYIQLIGGNPWGNNPLSDTGLLLTTILSSVFMIALIVFISAHKLTLKIDEGSIYVKFRPYFDQREYRLDEFQKIYVRKYQPVLEYGGWGLRAALRKNKAYNIVGRWGLQLQFNDGRKLLIGTRQPKKLDQVIQQLTEAHG